MNEQEYLVERRWTTLNKGEARVERERERLGLWNSSARVDFDGSKIPLPPPLPVYLFVFFISPRITRRVWQVTLSRCMLTRSRFRASSSGNYAAATARRERKLDLVSESWIHVLCL